MDKKIAARVTVYSPPGPDFPFLTVVLFSDGSVHAAASPTEPEAKNFARELAAGLTELAQPNDP